MLKLLMLPDYKTIGLNNGVGQTILNYHNYLPKVGIKVTTNSEEKYNISASHLGYKTDADIFFSHGFWFGKVNEQMAQQNKVLTECALRAKAVIVPSNYVAETFRREFRINPHIIGHAVNFEDWQHEYQSEGYVLWNKNRIADVCSPEPVYELAKQFPKVKFYTTLTRKETPNMVITGILDHDKMKPVIQKAGIYLATAKETFGIGTLEALAAGVPVLGFRHGGTADIITHKQDGYLVNPGDYKELANGLDWLLDNRASLTDNCKEKAKKYNWLDIAKKIKGVIESVIS